MPAELRNLDVRFVSLVDRAAVRDPSNPTEPQRLLLWKAEDGAHNNNGGSMPTIEELSAALETAETERTALTAQVEKLEKKLAKQSKKEDDPDGINKADLDPKVAARLEKLEKAEIEAAEKLAKAEEVAKSERDARIEKEYITKAEKEYSLLPMSAEEFGPVLKRAEEALSEEDFKVFQTILKAQDEHLVLNSQMFRDIGRGGDIAPSNPGVSERLDKAEELMKTDPNLSKYDAMRRAMGSREAQQAYLAEARGL